MKQDIKKQALQLARLLNERGVGHTSLMMEGFYPYEGEAIAVFHNDKIAREIAGGLSGKHAFSIEDLDRTRGLRLPVCVDHKVIADLLNGLVFLCDHLKVQLERAEA